MLWVNGFPGWRLRDKQHWSTLIQKRFGSDSALFITWKFMKSAVSALIFSEIALIQSWTELISSKTALNNTHFDGLMMVRLVNFSIFFEVFGNTAISRHISLICEWIGQQTFSSSVFLWAEDTTNTQNFGTFVTARVNKLIWFNFSNAFFPVLGWNFKIISKNSSFCCHFAEYWGI